MKQAAGQTGKVLGVDDGRRTMISASDGDNRAADGT